MSETETESYKTERKYAVDCFNGAWDFLDKTSLTIEEEKTMLDLAHASSFHWSKIGKPRNFSISAWQISRCYAKINEGSLALKYAQKGLQLLEENKIEDLITSGYEGMARAYAVLKDFDNAKKYIELAEKELEKVTEKGDREVFEPQIKDTKSMIE